MQSQTSEKSEGRIYNGQSRYTGNIGQNRKNRKSNIEKKLNIPGTTKKLTGARAGIVYEARIVTNNLMYTSINPTNTVQ